MIPEDNVHKVFSSRPTVQERGDPQVMETGRIQHLMGSQ
jgi:hypothetical protein